MLWRIGADLSTLHVVEIRYRSDRRFSGNEKTLASFGASGVYAEADVPFEIVQPSFPEDRREAETPGNLGWLAGAIADEVALGLRHGSAVLVVGGDCSHATGVLGGLQDVYGPAARIGLVWMDAHGDFNTPRTTLTGRLGGMPVAVCAGLAYPIWRERSHVAAPLPTDRIVLVDIRNLDEPEERLIRATEATIASPAPGFPGADLAASVRALSDRCDLIYLHIDSDVLDGSLVPNHGTREPNGPSLAQVQAAIHVVMSTGKVAAFAVVSMNGEGEGGDVTVASGIELVRAGLRSWRRYGQAVAV